MLLKDTLIRPLVTEKSTAGDLGEGTYAFEVALSAGKGRVKEAVEAFFGVRVASVRTLVVRGKSKRFGRHFGKRKNWKKAYVTVADGGTINVFE